MATFSSVQRPHVEQALAEYDRRGADNFCGAYHFEPQDAYLIRHDGRGYDLRAVLGVAHQYATGRIATSAEFGDGLAAAAALVRRRGFEVSEPARAAAAAPVRRPPAVRAPRAPRSGTTAAPKRRVAESDRPVALCPTCFMALPATGVCDSCG